MDTISTRQRGVGNKTVVCLRENMWLTSHGVNVRVNESEEKVAKAKEW